MPRDFLRHYYDIYELLDRDEVKVFIGTEKYLEHKKTRFGSLNQNLTEGDAFKLEDTETRKLFEKEYERTNALYYGGRPTLVQILDRIEEHLPKL